MRNLSPFAFLSFFYFTTEILILYSSHAFKSFRKLPGGELSKKYKYCFYNKRIPMRRKWMMDDNNDNDIIMDAHREVSHDMIGVEFNSYGDKTESVKEKGRWVTIQY